VKDDAPPADRAYAFVEGLHLRQWALRVVVPLAALATNGSGRLDAPWLPRHDAPAVFAPAETGLRVAGVALVVAAAALRVLAKGVLVRKTTLTTGGVYGVVRHPFYLANLVGAVGTFLCAGALGAAVCAAWLVVAAPIYAATVRGEERALARLFPSEFAAYAARVRALVPGLPPRVGERTAVTWSNLVLEREPPRLLRFVAGAAVVFGLTFAGAASAVVLGAAALLFAVSYFVD
jgi:protein-S-isoprenylcysteine O-methyltransferase Ste14